MRTSLLEKWIEENNLFELRSCRWMVEETLKNWKKVFDEMEADKGSLLWNDNQFLCVHREYKKLLKVSKQIKKLLTVKKKKNGTKSSARSFRNK